MDERIEHWDLLYAPDAHYFGIFVTVLFVFFAINVSANVTSVNLTAFILMKQGASQAYFSIMRITEAPCVSSSLQRKLV